jgi:hypothetical protein
MICVIVKQLCFSLSWLSTAWTAPIRMFTEPLHDAFFVEAVLATKYFHFSVDLVQIIQADHTVINVTRALVKFEAHGAF